MNGFVRRMCSEITDRDHDQAHGMVEPETDFMGGVVMSIRCEMSPSLCLPDENEVDKFSDRRGEFRLASGQIPNLSPDLFCESMSLACNGYID